MNKDQSSQTDVQIKLKSMSAPETSPKPDLGLRGHRLKMEMWFPQTTSEVCMCSTEMLTPPPPPNKKKITW